MDTFEIYSFIDDLKISRDFLLDIEAHREQIAVFGLKKINRLKNFEDASVALTKFETQLLEISKFARFINPDIHQRIEAIMNDSVLVTHGHEFSLLARIESLQKPSITPISLLSSAINSYAEIFGLKRFKGTLADDGNIPVRKMLMEIERLIPLIDQLDLQVYHSKFEDTEIFKPSNINVEQIGRYINLALESINTEVNLKDETKKQLEEYLKEVRIEIVKETPAWKKIVGALVIISTILGGCAVAPTAYKNVNLAIKHILGTSIDEVPTLRDSDSNFIPFTQEI